MKNLRLTFGVAALAIGSFAAFSFAPANTVNEDETGIFYRNADGSMGASYDEANHPCQGSSSEVCAQEYNLETELPTGNNIKTGVRKP